MELLAAGRRIRGWFGATLWRAARFWTAKELAAMVKATDLTAGPVRGAIFFPPWTALARVMAPLDPQHTALGAAFVALQATKPGGAEHC